MSTPISREKVRAIFHYFDRDASGKLGKEDFFDALLAAGVHLTCEQFENEVVAEFGSSQIAFIKFSKAVEKYSIKNVTPEELKETFQPFTNDKGEVSVDTLRYILRHSNLPSERLSADQAESIVCMGEPGEDGMVNVENLVNKIMPRR